MFGSEMKMLRPRPTPNIGIPALLTSPPPKGGKQQVLAQVLRFLSPTQQTQTGFLVPGFSLA